MTPHGIVKIEEPDPDEERFEDEDAASDEDIDAAVAAIDESLHIYGVKVWPAICDTIKLKTSTPRRRELCRKCTGLVLKKDPNVHDRSVAKCLAARYKEHKIWAGTLNRFALVIRNKFRPKSSRAIPVVVVDDHEEEGVPTPPSEDVVGGTFPRVEIKDRAEFHSWFCLFVEKFHSAYLVELSDLKPQTLEKMIIEAFKGEKTIRAIASDLVEASHFRRICNAMASLYHAYSRRMILREEENKACVTALMEFCEKYGFVKDSRRLAH